MLCYSKVCTHLFRHILIVLVVLYTLLFLFGHLPELDHGRFRGAHHFILDHVIIQDVVQQGLQEIQGLLGV